VTKDATETLTGAQVAFSVQNLQTYRLVPHAGRPSLKLAAAFDIMDSVYLAFSTGRSLTAENLAGSLPSYPRPIVAEVLAMLEAGSLVHVSQADERLLPTSPLEQHNGKAVVEIILGNDIPDTTGGRQSFTAIEAAAHAVWLRRSIDQAARHQESQSDSATGKE
jgi:hypothetical protein